MATEPSLPLHADNSGEGDPGQRTGWHAAAFAGAATEPVLGYECALPWAVNPGLVEVPPHAAGA